MEIVKPPVKKCKRCETLFCAACLNAWNLRGNTKCPAGCGQNPMQGKMLGKFERNTLNRQQFNCFQCKLPFKYSELENHLDDKCVTKFEEVRHEIDTCS
jgi:hypothetical protein